MAKKRCNWPKHLLQWGTLAAIVFFISGLALKLFPKITAPDPETYCPLGGLEAFGTYLVQGSLPCSMSSMQILMGLALAAAAILFSKLFCAFLCPIGTVEDFLFGIRKMFNINGLEVKEGGVADKILRFIKYAMLFWIFYMTCTASELFCKHLDPYYAVATGFKGEIVLWMSIVTVSLVVLGGIVIKRFWCRYICPLGAAANSFKFWLPLLVLVGVWYGVKALGANLPWWVLLAAWCLLGYALEAFCARPKLQPLSIIVDGGSCKRSCHSCQKACPYNIDAPAYHGRVTAVDCTLCGECVNACPSRALSVGVLPDGKKRSWTKVLPAAITVVIFALCLIFGGKFEIPTIDVSWGITDSTRINTVRVDNLRSVKCYGSSMAFKARMEKVAGVHGVKTFVKSHSVVIKYDPDVTSADKIRQLVFVPSHFRVHSPDPAKLSELTVKTIRVEKMYDKLDLNYLGLQLRNTGKSIFGVVSEYECPVVVRVYMSAAEADTLDAAWFKEIVNRKVLAMPVHGGGVKETPMNLQFVRMEEETSTIGISEYLHMMFDGFKAEYKGKYPAKDTVKILNRKDVYAGKAQYVYEIANQSYEKPIIKRSIPFLSNHVSKEEGVIGTYLCLNEDLVPCIRIRYAYPMTEKKLWELLNMETWTITYKAGEVKEVPAKMKFKKPGVVKRWTEE